ncbi:MAG: hypothetical protein AAF648_00060 [Pseudomonadota bacterium]
MTPPKPEASPNEPAQSVKLEIESWFAAPVERVFETVQRSRLLHYIAAPMIRFRTADDQRFPERWTEGSYRAWLMLFGFVPLGWQVVRIESLPDDGETRRIRDNGYGWLIQRWDHEIRVSPADEGSRYVDRITVTAGWRTPFVAGFAAAFYRHRQRRWQRLIANNFDFER